MKHIFTFGLAVLLLAGTVQAQDDLVRQKAVKIRDQNNVQQGVTQPQATAPAASAPAATPSGPQGINASQQQLVDRLESDFAVVKTGTAAPANQTQSMVNEMTALAKGANKPTKPELAKLATDLALALAEKSFEPEATAALARDVNIIENCAVLTPARAQTFVAEAQMTLRKSGVSDANVQAVGTDLKAIVAEVQKKSK